MSGDVKRSGEGWVEEREKGRKFQDLRSGGEVLSSRAVEGSHALPQLTRESVVDARTGVLLCSDYDIKWEHGSSRLNRVWR